MRTHVQAAGNAPTVYTPEVLRDFGAQVSAAGPVTIGPGTDPYGAPSTVATITVADITSFFEGQTARVYVDCVAGIVCSSEQVNVTGYPISGIIFDVQPTSGTAGTVTLGGVGNFPSPLTGRTFAATMYYPGGGTTDSAGNFYITDSGNSRIVMFDSDGTFLRSLGSYGSPLALDDATGWPSNDSLGATCYDVWFNPIDRDQCSDQPADLLGYFNWPEDVAVSADGNTLVVADSFNYRVQIFTRSDTGTVVASDGTRYDVKAFGEWGLDGPAGEFSTPWGIALTPSGRILVTETENDRVQILDPVADPLAVDAPSVEVVTNDGTTAYHVTILGHHGDSSAGNEGVAFELNHPHDVAVDSSTGRILVADSDNNRIQVFDPSGLVPGTTCPVTGTQDANCITSVAILGRPDGEQGGGTPDDGIADGWDGEEFANPWGVTADADGRLFVTELTNDRIQIFDRTDTGYEWVTSLGRSEGTTLDLIGPSGIAVAPDGAATADDSHWLWVVDTLGHRMQQHVPARLTITGTEVLPASFAVGGHATLTVTVKNTGAVAISGVTVSLPTSDHAFGSASLETATANLAAGEERDYEFELSATAAKPAWHLTARATGTLGTVPISSADAAIAAIEVTPPPQPTLVAQLTAPAQATLNTDFTAQVQVQAGAVDLTNIEITLNAAGSAATITSNTDTIAALAAGATATSFFTVRGTAVGTINLTATFTSDETEAFGTAAQTTPIRAVPVAADTAAPDITLTPIGTGDNGWIRTVPGVPVPVRLDASDPSGVAKIVYWSNSTELTPQGPIAVTVSGTSTSITRQLTREGETRIAYWAEDAVGNPTTPAGGKPAVGESLNAFCSRLPAKCTTVKIDTLPPSLSRDSIVINQTHTQVSVHFSTNDEHSTVRLVCLAVPTPTSPDCLSGPNAQIVLDSGSTTRGTLILTASPGTEVYGTVRVTDFAGYTAEFQLPFAADYGPNADNDLYFTHRTLTVPVGTGVRANDDDPLGNISQWNVTQLTRPADGPRHGTVTLNANGSFTYVPDTGYFGPDDFVYKLTKVGSAVESAPAQVNINVVNLPPVGVADTYSVAKNATLNVNVAQGVLSGPGGDSDPDGDTITAALVQNTANGTLTLNANGSFTYVPNHEFAGTDTFKYRAVDGFSNSLTALGNVATVTITVVNQAPDGTNKAYTTHKTVTKTQADLLVGATDADDPLATLTVAYLADSRCPVAGRVAPTKGTVTVNGDGSFTYTSPAPNLGTDTFSFCVLDPHGRDADLTNGGVSTNRIVTITLTNIAPTAGNNAYTTHKTLTVAAPGILTNDSDGDTPPDTITPTVVSSPTHGTLTVQLDGSFVYTPLADGFVGVDTFTYTVNDGYGPSNTATVSITITNAAPVAVNDAYTVPKNVLTTITAANGVIQRAPGTDSDSDGDALTASLVSNVSHGTLTFNTDGSFAYTPTTGYVGIDTFTYRVADGYSNGTSNIATVTLTVTNQAPVAVNDAYSTAGLLTVALLNGIKANDTDADDPIGTATITVMTNVQHGTLVLLPTGAFTYLPNLGFHGTDTFTYRLNDGIANGNTATVTITVGNAPPVAVNDAYNAQKNTALAVPVATGVRANDSDLDDPITSVNVVLVANPTNGTVMLTSSGSFTYTPTIGFNGVDTFTYKLNDGQADSNTATVTITITNRAPVAVNDTYVTSKNVTLNVNVASGVILNTAGRDSDPDNDPIVATLVSTTTNGTLTFNAAGSFTYVPATGFVGTDSFTYKVNDGVVDSNVATVTINITNSTTVAVNDSYSTPKNTTLTVTAANGIILGAGRDTDADNDPLTATLVSTTTRGTLTLSPDGSFTYVPNPGLSGPDTFTYTASDGPSTSNVATVTITVTNQAPVAVADTYSTHGLLTVAAPIGVRANDSDPDNPLTDLTVTVISPTMQGAIAVSPDGSFTYTPAMGYSGVDAFTYRLSDGLLNSNTVSVTINIVNIPPVAAPDTYTTAKNTALTVAAGAGVIQNAAGFDSDGDGDPLTAILQSAPANGVLNSFQQSGAFTYTPNPGFDGVDTFTYLVRDGYTSSNTTTVRITVTNQAPVANNDAYNATKGVQLTVPVGTGVRANDTDVDDDPATLIVTLMSSTAHGTLNLAANGSFTYQPAAGYVGTDTFTYKVNDGSVDSATATVTITIANSAPVAANDSYTAQRDTTLNVNAAAGVILNPAGTDTDANGDTLTAVLNTTTQHGALTLNANGSFTYVPATGYFGLDSFTYHVNDGTSDSNVATVTINVLNGVPVAVNDAYTTHGALTVGSATGVRANDSDPDTPMTSVFVTLVSSTSHGSLTLGPSGEFIYAPNTGFVGTDSFTYRLNDGTSNSNVATVTITVTNAAPVAVNDSFTTLRNTTLTISAANGVIQNAAGRDTDADNDPLTAALVAGVAHGTLTLGPGGDFVYTPTTGYTGTDTFTYRVNDGRVDSNVATVTIRIDPPNYTTFTQGGWGANPSGGNPGMKLQQNWATVYGSAGYVQIGGTRTARWTTSAAVAAFLPASGGANVFTTNYTNATSTSARVFAGQALALRLNIDFSNAGIHRTGLGSKRVKSGKLAGYTVNQVMALANTVIGGTTSALPSGVSINDLSAVCDNINNNYDNGTQDRGYLE